MRAFFSFVIWFDIDYEFHGLFEKLFNIITTMYIILLFI